MLVWKKRGYIKEKEKYINLSWQPSINPLLTCFSCSFSASFSFCVGEGIIILFHINIALINLNWGWLGNFPRCVLKAKLEFFLL